MDELVYCDGPNDSTSCIGTVGGINHNKTFAFSNTGDMAGVLLGVIAESDRLSRWRADSSGGIEPEAKTDTISELLSTVEYEEGCRIDVTQAYFTRTRTLIHDHLIRLGAVGCDVRIVCGAHLGRQSAGWLPAGAPEPIIKP